MWQLYGMNKDPYTNPNIDYTNYVFYFKNSKGRHIATAQLKTGEWAIFCSGCIDRKAPWVEEVHMNALAFYRLTGSVEGYPEIEMPGL